jgi:glutathione S-transferase
MTLRLYTFAISHFAEKARWALDYKGIQYEEKRLVPGSHIPIIKRIAPRTTVPVLVDGERVIQGSSAIIDHVDVLMAERPLTPRDASERERASELEPWLDRELGEPLRRVLYHYALDRPELVISLFTQGTPWWGKAFCRVAFPLLKNRIRTMYKINAENVALDKERVAKAFERIDALLASSAFLAGDHFSRADITLAALTAPIWSPGEHPLRWPAAERYPQEIRDFRGQFAGTRARDHVLRAYRDYRRPSRPLAS